MATYRAYPDFPATRSEAVLKGWGRICFTAILAAIIVLALIPNTRNATVLLIALISGIAIMIGYFVVAAVARWRALQLLEKLQYMICPDCRYHLKPLEKEGRCPECGSAYEAEWLKHLWTVRYTPEWPEWHDEES